MLPRREKVENLDNWCGVREGGMDRFNGEKGLQEKVEGKGARITGEEKRTSQG